MIYSTIFSILYSLRPTAYVVQSTLLYMSYSTPYLYNLLQSTS